MTYFRLGWLVLLAGLALITAAQPAVDETWLVIVPTLEDGGELPGRALARLSRVEGEKRTAVMARPSFTPEGRIVFMNLPPGEYEVTLYFPTLGLNEAPRRVTVRTGYNAFTWKLPPITLARLALTAEGKAVKASVMQLFLLTPTGEQASPTPVEEETEPGIALFPGVYRLALFTEHGYAITELKTAEAKDGKLLVRLPLRRGGTVRVLVTNTGEKAIPGAQVTFSRTIAPGFPVSFTVLLRDPEAMQTPMLPPGEWRWKATRVGYQPKSDAVTLSAEKETELTIELLRAR
ncbi:MAG: hypothetical protein BWY76_00583 [bacterium ADurb.Bin429]|nr:MAG: hypothetical protein BWY76_00583 [bacterium ADurb.Bin429]